MTRCTTDDTGTEVFRNAHATVRTFTSVQPNGSAFEQTLFTPGTGQGVMVIPATVVDGEPMLGLIRIVRPTTHGQTSYEFPRGGSIDLSDLEAFWLLTRETGISAANLTPLGAFLPENGMVDCVVAVFLATVTRDDAADADGFTDPDTGADFSWYTVDEFTGLLRDGLVLDGITLASWALAVARFDDLVPGRRP